LNAVLANEPAHSGAAQRLGDADLGMRFSGPTRQSAIESLEELASPWPAGRDPVCGHGEELVVTRSSVVGRLLDYGEEVVGSEPPGEVEGRPRPRRDSDAVVALEDVSVVARIGSIRNDPSGDRRIARTRRDHVDSAVGRESAKSPETPRGRAGDGDIRACGAHRSALAQFGDRRTRCPIGPAQHQFESSVMLEALELTLRHSRVEQLLRRGNAVLACE
jgi:hypothetical protein